MRTLLHPRQRLSWRLIRGTTWSLTRHGFPSWTALAALTGVCSERTTPNGSPRGSEDREGASDSVPVLGQGRGGRWLGCGCSQPPVLTVLGLLSVMEAFGRISSSTCPLPRDSHMEIWTLPLPSYLSVLRCLGVALSTWYSGRVLGSTVDTCFTRGFWRTSHIFYVWCTQIVAFLSIPQNGEVCTVDASSCSVSSRASHFESGHYFHELFM